MASCDSRWWVLRYGRACGPVVIETTNEDRGPSRREGAFEVIDRRSDSRPARERPADGVRPFPVVEEAENV